MKVEISDIRYITLIPECDSDKALLKLWCDGGYKNLGCKMSRLSYGWDCDSRSVKDMTIQFIPIQENDIKSDTKNIGLEIKQ
jgi:hypothetical protein